MSAEKRSALMGRIRGKGTKPEMAIQAVLEDLGLEFETHVRSLPGRPDFVLYQHRLAIFVDGDFWHGWQFDKWRLKLSEHWEAKIDANRRRDQRNHRKLRRQGWRVLRIWEHQVRRSIDRCRDRIVAATAVGLPIVTEPGNLAPSPGPAVRVGRSRGQ